MAEPYSPQQLQTFLDSIRDSLRGHEDAGQWLGFHAAHLSPAQQETLTRSAQSVALALTREHVPGHPAFERRCTQFAALRPFYHS